VAALAAPHKVGWNMLRSSTVDEIGALSVSVRYGVDLFSDRNHFKS
jgi:hypothetical protein